MSVGYNPRIVNNSLLTYLDAGNPRSYTGSGTAWSDLSNNNIAGTLVNTPSYSNGVFTLNGSDQYMTLPMNFFNQDSGTPFSISIWFKTSVNGGILFGQTNNNNFASATGYVPAFYLTTSGYMKTSTFWGGVVTNHSTSPTVVADGIWHNMTVTMASGVQKSYLDGTIFDNLNKTQTTYTGTYYYFIGTGKGADWPSAASNAYFTGSISNLLFYTKELTAAEVKQNFNALRGRFGI